MKDDESIQDMHTRFTSIINELYSLGEIIPRNKLLRKILSVLDGSWQSKVNAITEAKDLQKLTIDELIGNLKTYEMKNKKDHERREPKREKNSILMTDNNESSGEDTDMAYLTKRFQKIVRKNGDKAAKKNPVPDKRFKRKEAADNIVKQSLAAWGDSSSESGEDDAQGNTSMMAVESEGADYDSIFSLMAKSDDDEDNDDGELISLANVLIDAYHCLINDRNALTTELGEIEHERDDLVVVAVDLRETIESLNREKDILTERSANIEHEREDLLVVVVDLKETIEELRRKSRPMNIQKGKEVASKEDLGRVKNDLEKSLKWTWSSDTITVLYKNNGGNRQVIGFQREKTPYNPHRKYVTIPDNWLCTHCGNTVHFKETCKAKFQSQQKNKVFAKKVTTVKEPGPLYKRCMMPAWTKKVRIHPFPNYKGPKLVWVPKSNP
ncbi:uncharacterized protein [Nicotiana tomentosiformis]|uniref:uncharacterized protein n=1 Tax=Nicotiana tomentosiformis TaxID=4098 RepID=UPI00388CD7F1